MLLAVAMLGLIAAVAVPVVLTTGTDKSLNRSAGPTSAREDTSATSTQASERTTSASPPAADESAQPEAEYQPQEEDTAAVVDAARRYFEAINAGDEALADSLTCEGVSLVWISAEGATLTVGGGEVEWSYSGDTAFVPYLVDGQPAGARLVMHRRDQGFCPTL